MRAFFIILLPATLAFAEPVLRIQHAASPGVQRGEVAPRSLVDIFLTSSEVGEPAPSIDHSLPVSVAIQPLAGGDPFEAAVEHSIFSFRIRARLPEDLPLGPAELSLHFNEGERLSTQIEVVRSSFGLFTIGSGYRVPAVALNVMPGAQIEVNGLTKPIRPGGWLTLWGTGLGLARPEEVTVSLGGHNVPVAYAGRAPDLPGIDQINVHVPDNAAIPDGCYVPLVVAIRGQPHNQTSVTKMAGNGPCEHPLGLNLDQMTQLDAGGSVGIGRIGIYSSVGPFSSAQPEDWKKGFTRFEHTDVSVLAVDAASFAQFSRAPADIEFGCQVFTGVGSAIAGLIRTGGGISLGQTLDFTGPNGKSAVLAPDSEHFFGRYVWFSDQDEPTADPGALPPPFLTTGEWEITAPGSEQAIEFRRAIRLPPPVEVTNFADLQTVDRTRDLTVTWNPIGYWPSDVMVIALSGTGTASNPFFRTTAARSVQCLAPAPDGQVTIPAALLQDFDAAAPAEFPTPALHLSVSGPEAWKSRFSIQLRSGESLPGQISHGSTLSMPVTIR